MRRSDATNAPLMSTNDAVCCSTGVFVVTLPSWPFTGQKNVSCARSTVSTAHGGTGDRRTHADDAQVLLVEGLPRRMRAHESHCLVHAVPRRRPLGVEGPHAPFELLKDGVCGRLDEGGLYEDEGTVRDLHPLG